MNLADKADLPSLGHPRAAGGQLHRLSLFAQQSHLLRGVPESRPEHLIFDARRMDIGDYLLQPLHQFAKGSSAQNTVAPELSGTMRRRESCHSIDATHEWLPYKDRHMETVSCESCHVPTLYASRPSRWTGPC
ncbi:MAG: hypothetical protein R2838_08945 [Caldilineaceae bacterium]